MKPLVSVVIPVYNADKFLEETVRSAMQQTVSNIEILLVNDGSTDNSFAIMEKLAAEDARIKLLQQPNLGVSAARNLGYSKSTGKYIAFLDADDVWLRNNLELKLKKFTTGDFGLVHSDGKVINEKSELVPGLLQGREGNLLHALLAWKETQIPNPSSILISREVMENVGLFDESLSTSADQDFFIRTASQFTIGRIPEVTWLYRIHRHNMHKNIARMEHDVLRVFAKAKHQAMFGNKSFERQCLANMYLILAASWAGDGNNLFRGLLFVWKAFTSKPAIIFKLPTRILKKWLR